MMEERIDTFLLFSWSLQFRKENNANIIVIMGRRFLIYFLLVMKSAWYRNLCDAMDFNKVERKDEIN